MQSNYLFLISACVYLYVPLLTFDTVKYTVYA